MADREITFYPNNLTTLLSSLKAKQRGITTDAPADPNNESIWEESKGWITYKDTDGDSYVVSIQKYYDTATSSWIRKSNVFADLEVEEIYTEVGLIDQFLGSAVPISESGVTTLDAGFTASSIVGCLNELLDSIVTPDPFWKALSADTVSPRDENGYDYVYVNSGLKDQYCSGISLAESGETGLDSGFTAASLVGALNELINMTVIGFANPSVTVGLTVKNGAMITAMRSDAAPALDQGIAPTWTSDHTWETTKKVIFRDSALYISSKGDGYLDFDADTGFRFNTGNVGIGCIPNAKLEVVISSGTAVAISNATVGMSIIPEAIVNDRTVRFTNNSSLATGGWDFFATDGAFNASCVKIQNNGYVGIGTVAPLLNVGSATGDFDTYSSGLHIKSPSSYNARLILEGGSASTQGYRNAANSIIFCNTTMTTANNRMFIIGQDCGNADTGDFFVRPINADGSIKSYRYNMSVSTAEARYETSTSDAVGYALQLRHHRNGSDLTGADVVGSIDFVGRVSSAWEIVGQIESRYYGANGGQQALRFLTNGTLAMYIEDHGGGIYIQHECDIAGYLNAKDLVYIAQKALIGANYGSGYDPLNNVGSSAGDFAARSVGMHILAPSEYQARLILEGESKCDNSFTNGPNSIIFCNKTISTANKRLMLIGQDGGFEGANSSDFWVRSLDADGTPKKTAMVLEQDTGHVRFPNLPVTTDVGFTQYAVYYDTGTDKLYYYDVS